MLRSATLCATGILLCCTLVKAGVKAKDPIIIIAGDDDVARSEDSFPLGSSFSILSPTGSSPVTLQNGSPCEVAGIEVPLCLFSNGTDFTWTTLSFSITPGSQIGPFTCLALAYFSSCGFSDDNQKVTFAGGPGIGAGEVFLFAAVLWLPNTNFSGEAVAVESSRVNLRGTSLGRSPAPPAQPSAAELFLDGQVAMMDRFELGGGGRFRLARAMSPPPWWHARDVERRSSLRRWL